MPELPDVENFRRYLNATALHKTIAGVTVGSTKILRGISARAIGSALRGRRMERTRRHGKHLFVALDNGRWLTLHFGMSGRLTYFKDMKDDPPDDRLRFDFDNGAHLAYQNRRLLGRVGLADDPDAFIADEGLGPDATDSSLDEAAFVTLLAGRRGQIKPALMDQHLLAGIGNIYSDEILFQARLHPASLVRDLARSRLRTLYKSMRTVLDVAIDRGAGSEELVRRLPSSYLLPHREEGAKCPRCGGKIETVKASGRTAYYCPRCQPAPR